ncbi:CoA transferase [Dactylosporangium sp. AC04546]|uniref:CaiB/BaiF CoA transferase family protein n=1 Tax=Dactylosporangium sp. AC04546 TaxID=2862460 RepID=UPI001EDEB9D7|nr:CoA transferase [Dactylosporangium sp. AC04546]WVK78768.1 CoA transferase [Dactylosporangium sp. AC04546]
MSPEPLDGVTVVDWTDHTGAYAGRLLADLGADVIRVVPPGGDPAARVGPFVTGGDGRPVSTFERFVNLNKRSVTLDVAARDGRDVFLRLVGRAQVLLHTAAPPALAALGLGPDELGAANPGLVQVSVRPFGATGPYRDHLADDLVQLAAGGLLSLGGYADTAPIAVAGHQTYLAGSIVAAGAALLGLLGRLHDGRGRAMDVSVQEAIAGALEDAVPTYDLTGRVRRRLGEVPREAGTGTFPCRDGHVAMVAGRLGTAKAWTALVGWMAESGVDGAAELTAALWEDFRHRQSEPAIARFREVFGAFAATRTKAELYAEAQRRRIALAPVNDVTDLRADAQLAHRGFFVPVDDPVLGATLVYPGRASVVDGRTTLAHRPAPAPGQHTGEVLTELGVGDEQRTTLVAAGVL